MSFSCPNINESDSSCKRLKTLCVIGRPGCVLEGKVKFSQPLEERIKRAEEAAAKRRRT